MELKTACQMTTNPFERLKVLAEVVLQAPEGDRSDIIREMLRAVSQLKRPHIEMDRYAFYHSENLDSTRQELALAGEYCLALYALSGERDSRDVEESIPWLENLARVSKFLSPEERSQVLAKANTLSLDCGLTP